MVILPNGSESLYCRYLLFFDSKIRFCSNNIVLLLFFLRIMVAPRDSPAFRTHPVSPTFYLLQSFSQAAPSPSLTEDPLSLPCSFLAAPPCVIDVRQFHSRLSLPGLSLVTLPDSPSTVVPLAYPLYTFTYTYIMSDYQISLISEDLFFVGFYTTLPQGTQRAAGKRAVRA